MFIRRAEGALAVRDSLVYRRPAPRPRLVNRRPAPAASLVNPRPRFANPRPAPRPPGCAGTPHQPHPASATRGCHVRQPPTSQPHPLNPLPHEAARHPTGHPFGMRAKHNLPMHTNLKSQSHADVAILMMTMMMMTMLMLRGCGWDVDG